MDLESEEHLEGEEQVIAEAKRRFKVVEEWEGQSRNLFLDDIKFANGDSDNMYQWDSRIREIRNKTARPCMTVNKTQTFNYQVINEALKNKSSVTVRPVGDEATYEAAEVMEGIIRHIEYISDAASAYETAIRFQVEGGIGYARIVTDYAGDDSFDQEIYIRRIKDPLTVYLDPDINEIDGSDARFAFIFEDMPIEVFRDTYPKYKDKASTSPLGTSDNDGWIDKNHVRVAEYYRLVKKEKKMVAFTDPTTGQIITEYVDNIPPELVGAVVDDPATRNRIIYETQVEHYLIVGDQIAEKNLWPGKYIPIARLVGIETVIDGKLDRKGHTRALKDPQRNYNYWTSKAIEGLALQTNVPWLAPAAAIEGYETIWKDANTSNPSILPYKHIDSNGAPIQKPERIQPPVMAEGFLKGMQVSEKEMMMASGQYQDNLGQQSNAISGRAINERQRQGDIATYHFANNQGTFIRFIGKIVLDLIPRVYDTQRVVNILAEDNTQSHVILDPNAPQSYQAVQGPQGAQPPQQPGVNTPQPQDQWAQKRMIAIKGIFNPNIGKYDIMSDTGPSYGTKRQEAYNALSQIMQQQPQIAHLVGDLWASNSDFPESDKIAERFRNLLPPQALGNGPTPQMQQAQEQMQALQIQLQKANKVNATLLQTIAEDRLKSRSEAAQKEIDVYKAETERMKAEADIVAKHLITPRQEAEMIHDLAKQEHSGNMALVSTAMAHDLSMAKQEAPEEEPQQG
jgi:hypothetical protein